MYGLETMWTFSALFRLTASYGYSQRMHLKGQNLNGQMGNVCINYIFYIFSSFLFFYKTTVSGWTTTLQGIFWVLL